MRADTIDILRILPQRNPLLLIDAIDTDGDGDTAIAYKNITFNEPCFRAVHTARSRESLAYPLSLHVESFGQGAALLLEQRGFLTNAGSTQAVVFGEFSGIDILGQAYPGDRLRHEIKLTLASTRMVILSGRTLVDERVIITFGSLKAFLVDAQAIAGADHA